MEKIRSSIANYVKLLPGPVTLQKYSSLDFDVKVDTILYGRILEEIINKFDHDWPLNKDDDLDPLIGKLIIVDGATVSMLSESLRALTASLSETNNEKKIRVISIILENLLKSDAIFSAIIDACRNENTRSYMQEKEIDQAWQNVTQILISLPNRVANKMRFDTLRSYMPEIYVKILCFHLSCAISFINDGLREHGIEPKTTVLSSFINKIVITFKPINNLTCLANIFEEWCFMNRKSEQRLVESIFRELDSTAVEHVAALFLKHCDPKFGVRAIFGDLLTASHWKYILTIKIPLMRYYEDEKLIINLISYLSSFPNENANLSELLIKLLEVWSDGSILNHTAVEQHEYITRLIVLSVKMCKNRLKKSERDRCQRLLLTGVSVHLECTDVYLRAMGMMTAEICVNSLCNTDDAPKLTFEYDNMPAKVSGLLDSLEYLNVFTPTVESKYEPSSDLTIGNIIFDSSAGRKIYELGVDCDILPSLENLSNERIGGSREDTRRDNLTKEKDNLVEKVARTRRLEEDFHRNHSDLDSDDDLVPYDMDDDKDKAFHEARPMYLRDLRDNLTDERTISNPDVFSESLLICEELILTQLPNDDASFAIELLQLLVTLRQQSYVENFELVVFRCCVAIVTVYPKKCAEFLCMQFYMDVGRYSLSQRLLFLDVLAEAAKQLSAINIDNVDSTDSSLDVTMKRKSVSNRVSLLIDTERCKTQEVYYNDDTDLEVFENQCIDWREIIDKRIALHTRRFTRDVKSPRTYINHFGNVVSSFFYPLLHGFGHRGEIYKLKDLKIYADQENILLLRFLKTLSVIMLAAQNCPLASKMGKEILELTWTLRDHDEATVRLAVTENIGSVLVAVSKDAIVDELSESLMEIREWLLLSLNVIYGEHDSNCRALNTKVLSFIDSIIGSTFN